MKSLAIAALAMTFAVVAMSQRVSGGPKAGEPAVEFELKVVGQDKKFTLKDNFGKRPTVLIFGSYT